MDTEQTSLAGLVDRNWYNHTTLHPLALVLTLLAGVFVLRLHRQYALIPFIMIACFVSPAQRLVVANLDFSLMRILLLFAWARVLMKREWSGAGWRKIDLFVILYAVSAVTVYTLREDTQDAFINRMGAMYDTLGFYFIFRCWIRGWSDFFVASRAFAMVALPVAGFFVFEMATQRNLFAMFGGVPEFTWMRNGRLRCQGPYPHPIIAGSFWSAVIPLMTPLLWHDRRNAMLAVAGLCAAALIVICSASSTPVSASIIALIGFALFPLRHRIRFIVITLALSLVPLHFAMKQPVWHLLARIDFIGGSTGWHRFHLIDEAIHHFPEWALLGGSTTEHWGNGTLYDVTNQYVLEGLRGGFSSLVLFCAVIFLAYRGVGTLLRTTEFEPRNRIAAWSLGVGLLVHTTTFIAVSYFGQQIDMVWYLNLAMIASLVSHPVRQIHRQPDAERAALPRPPRRARPAQVATP